MPHTSSKKRQSHDVHTHERTGDSRTWRPTPPRRRGAYRTPGCAAAGGGCGAAWRARSQRLPRRIGGRAAPRQGGRVLPRVRRPFRKTGHPPAKKIVRRLRAGEKIACGQRAVHRTRRGNVCVDREILRHGQAADGGATSGKQRKRSSSHTTRSIVKARDTPRLQLTIHRNYTIGSL